MSSEINVMEKKPEDLRQEIFRGLSPIDIVKLARHGQRPTALDYFRMVFEPFQELHGDRLFGDDPAMVGGTATFKEQPVMLIGNQKGKTTKENLYRNFGMAQPEGYRKALRLMKLAEKFNHPIIALVDTPGAYPGIGAEERGQAEAIARNLREMARLTVPVIVVITGEGGSGGALGIGVGNRVLMLQFAIYSVISPEGCAAILFRDAKRAPEAAKALRLTAPDLLELGVIDGIIEEPAGGAHLNPPDAARNIENAIAKHLEALKKLPPQELVRDRQEKFRRLGVFTE